MKHRRFSTIILILLGTLALFAQPAAADPWLRSGDPVPLSRPQVGGSLNWWEGTMPGRSPDPWDSNLRMPLPRPAAGGVGSAAADVIVVSVTDNEVSGSGGAHSIVNLELADAGGTQKGVNSLVTDGAGNFRGYLFPTGVQEDIDHRIDIAETDVLTITVGSSIYVLSVPLMPVTFDIPTSRVIGTALPYTDLSVSVHGQRVNLTTNFAGNYAASFVGRVDLMPADAVGIQLQANDVWVEKYAFVPGPLIRERANEVVGYVEPGLPVTATLYSELSEVKGTASSVGNSTDGMYQLSFGAGSPIDIAPNDSLVITTTEIVTVPVLPIQAVASSETDEVTGTAPPFRRVRVVLLHLGVEGMEWYVQHADSDSSGNYTVSFAGLVDIRPGDNVWITVSDATGATEVSTQPRLILVDQYNNLVQGRVEPGESVTITLRDSGGSSLEVATGQGDLATGHFEVQLSTKIIAGQSVEAIGQYGTATVDVVSMFVEVLIDEDKLIVTGPPSSTLYGSYDTWNAKRFHVSLITDQFGHAELSFADYDLRDGDEGKLYYDDEAGNINLYRYRQPYAVASSNLGRILMWGDRYTEIQVSLHDSQGALLATTTVMGNETGYADWWPPVGLSLGDRVTIACCNGREVELVMQELTSTLDLEQKSVRGVGPPNSLIEALILATDLVSGEESRYLKSTDSDINGNYQVDFDGLVNIRSRDRYQSYWQNPDGDWIFSDHYGTMISVVQSERAINGQGMANRSVMDITLTDVEGTEKTSFEATTDKWGDIEWTVMRPQIRFSDRVIVTDGEVTVTVPVDTLVAQIIPDQDRVTGTGLPDANIILMVNHPADSTTWWMRESSIGPDGSFDIDVSGAGDLLPGDEIAVLQENPQGHRVGIMQYGLQLKIHQTEDTVRIQSTPGSVVTLTLRSALGDVKEIRSIPIDADSGRSVLSDGQFDANIVAGDILEASQSSLDLSTAIKAISATIDLEANQILGLGPPNSFIRVDIVGRGGEDLTLYDWSDPTGRFVVGPGEAHQLVMGDSADVWYTDENGQKVGIWVGAYLHSHLPVVTRP